MATTQLSRADQKTYVDEVGSSLTAFQMIEESLKTTIDSCHKIVRLKLGGEIPFKFSGEEVDNAPLERLVSTYKKLCDEDTLIERLQKLQSDRNYVAHRALVIGFMQATKPRENYDAELKRVRDISANAWEVFKLMLTEMNRVSKLLESIVEKLEKER